MSVPNDGRFGVDVRVVEVQKRIVVIFITMPRMTLVALPREGGTADQFEAEVLMGGKPPIKGLKLTINLRETGFTIAFTDQEGLKILNGARVKDSWHLASLEKLGEGSD